MILTASFAYKSFASDIENDEITKILQETEDWLYDDESDEHDYTGKLSDLQKGSVTVVSYAKGNSRNMRMIFPVYQRTLCCMKVPHA
ncbi:heat shock 70 kDa protein 16 [Tanacetum coccineum]